MALNIEKFGQFSSTSSRASNDINLRQHTEANLKDVRRRFYAINAELTCA